MTTEHIISLPVISVYDQKVLGIVTNIYIYRKKAIAFKIVEQENLEEYILFTKDIYSIGTEAIIVKNQAKLNLLTSVELMLDSYSTPLGNLAFSLDGNIAKPLFNLELDSKMHVLHAKIGDQIIDASNLNFTKFSTIITKRINMENYAQKADFCINEAQNTRVSIQNPAEQHINISMLIGKTTTKDIVAPNGEIIVKKNTKINSSIVAKLSAMGKIKELDINSK